MSPPANHDALSDALTLVRPGPGQWSMTFAPGVRRRFKSEHSVVTFFLVAFIVFCIIVGTSMALWPIEVGADETSVLEYRIYGVICAGFGLWLMIDQYSRHLSTLSTDLALENGAFSLSSTEVDGEVRGCISSLRARLSSPGEDELHATLHLTWDGGEHVVQGLTADEMERLQRFFEDADILPAD